MNDYGNDGEDYNGNDGEDYNGRQRLSERAIERLVNCHENHEPGCPCRMGGDPIPRTIVIEDVD